MRIEVEFTDNTRETFEETSRAGGSYCTSMRYDEGFLIIEDAYGNQTVLPEHQIKKIKTWSTKGHF
jgi:hypothetical protein